MKHVGNQMTVKHWSTRQRTSRPGQSSSQTDKFDTFLKQYWLIVSVRRTSFMCDSAAAVRAFPAGAFGLPVQWEDERTEALQWQSFSSLCACVSESPSVGCENRLICWPDSTVSNGEFKQVSVSWHLDGISISFVQLLFFLTSDYLSVTSLGKLAVGWLATVSLWMIIIFLSFQPLLSPSLFPSAHPPFCLCCMDE